MFIVFEVLDGCGKDTQMLAVKAELEKQGKKVKIISNVDSGLMAKDIRKILNPENKLYIDNYHLALLILTNMKMIHKNVKKAEQDGYVVLCGRWAMSSIAYGCYTPDSTENTHTISKLDSVISVIDNFDIQPDLYLYLNVPVEVAVDRINKRCCSVEIYDSTDKLSKIKFMFDALSATQFDGTADIVEIVGNVEAVQITNNIMDVLKQKGL